MILSSLSHFLLILPNWSTFLMWWYMFFPTRHLINRMPRKFMPSKKRFKELWFMYVVSFFSWLAFILQQSRSSRRLRWLHEQKSLENNLRRSRRKSSKHFRCNLYQTPLWKVSQIVTKRAQSWPKFHFCPNSANFQQ